ncbi:uncharacterized protein [Argopecten irradians]|uniref:uncharacterized protein n=1 Tax=Argopecten irradians TaxID=31199 RepID=UPI003718D109
MDVLLFRLAICSVLGIISTTAIRFQGKYDWETEEQVTLHISDNGRYKRSSDGGISIPDVLGIHFDTSNATVSLSLRRNYDLTENVPVFVSTESGRIVQKHLPPVTDTAFYQDVKYGAAFTVKFQEKSSKVSNLFGSLHLRKDKYFLERTGDLDKNDPSLFHLRKFKVKAGMVTDFVKRKDHDTTKGNYAGTKAGRQSIRDKSRRGGKTDDGKSRMKRSVVQQTVEIMIASDHTIYDYWYADSSASTPSGKDTDAENAMRQFYAHSINEIDTMYGSVDSSSISISTVFACMYISKSAATSEWTEPIVSNGQVDASNVLDSFTEWEQQQTDATLCGYDHAMLFSRYDFTSTISGTVFTSTAGLAWLSGTCRTYKQSISEYSFDTSMNAVAAHELGHNLGADHDQDMNACLSSDSFIMAPSLGNGPDNARDNPWKFSSCSTTYFETYIATLGSQSCLLTLSTDHDPTALTPYDQEIPGQVTTADDQCVRDQGTGSYLCREQYNADYSDMCHTMWCRQPGSINGPQLPLQHHNYTQLQLPTHNTTQPQLPSNNYNNYTPTTTTTTPNNHHTTPPTTTPTTTTTTHPTTTPPLQLLQLPL